MTNSDPQIRWMASKRELGLPKDFLYQHHGDWYQDMVISGYDQEYNNSEILGKRALRHWDQHKLKWEPERTDYPRCIDFKYRPCPLCYQTLMFPECPLYFQVLAKLGNIRDILTFR